jgi:hypothetical protein
MLNGMAMVLKIPAVLPKSFVPGQPNNRLPGGTNVAQYLPKPAWIQDP